MKKKTLVMLLSTVLIITTAAFGTIAYLTNTSTVTNHFTVGNVRIDVDEAVVTPDGTPVGDLDDDGNEDRTSEGNTYHLMPRETYTKDPTLTVKAGSEKVYVRMMVTLSNAAEIDAIFAELQALYPETYPNGFVPGDYVTGRDNAVWVYTGPMAKDEVLNTYTLEFRYFEPVEPTDTEDAVLPPLFETIKTPGELTNADLMKLTNFTIDVNGHAIQTAGFADADEAWTAFDAQMTVTDIDSTQP